VENPNDLKQAFSADLLPADLFAIPKSISLLQRSSLSKMANFLPKIQF
jgi:hypothetical protein